MKRFLEVSLEAPDTFEKSMIKHNTSLSPFEYFSEFSPIFCTTEVPFKCIGEHMQNFAKQNNLSQKPRTLLVWGMKAEKILLATPLWKWYLEHGLICHGNIRGHRICKNIMFYRIWRTSNRCEKNGRLGLHIRNYCHVV